MPRLLFAVAAATALVATGLTAGLARASSPATGTLTPDASGSASDTWTGGPYTGVVADPSTCTTSTCDIHQVTLNVPAGYWASHSGSVKVAISWASTSDDFDLYVKDSTGKEIARSASASTTTEKVDLGQVAPGTYTVSVVPFQGVGATYTGTASLTSTSIPTGMAFPEDRTAVENELTVDYPLNVVFVGRKPTAAEVADLKAWTPDQYKPTVAEKSSAATGETTQAAAGLLNWNKDHVQTDPYFLGITYHYKINVLTASDAYAQALFDVAKRNTAADQTYHAGLNSTRTANQVRYDAAYGKYRVLAKGGDPSYAVTDPTKTDLVDAYSVEDWIFNSRYDAQWKCAFTNAETGACVNPSVIDPDASAYHDPYYDKFGLRLDRMPEGLNKGSSFFFLDTFTPAYAGNYFRHNAYHTWGTDKVINGAIVPKPVEQGGSWRITDPDTHDWHGVDFARTWGGRYRFHFVDLGAAPNDYEAASWAGKGLGMSSDYPHGDPPVWQYEADPLWQQGGDTCAEQQGNAAFGVNPPYDNNTPCRLMPRLARDVAYGLFFRSTAGYLYRPIPRGDVYWLAVTNWTDFYSHPQWVNGQLTNAPWYGTWWTDPDKLYRIGDVSGGAQQDDTLRWLSSATPYARWVGRKNEVIPLYDPTSNQPNGKTLDTSPKTADLPAPEYHVHQAATGKDVVPEPLYPGHHETVTYGQTTVDLTAVSNALEKAKANGLLGLSYDDSVNQNTFRDFIDAHRPGIADQVDGVNTIPSINMVFEKAYTWALPAIVGGVAVSTADGEAWGVMNNVNDRFGWCNAHYPAATAGDAPGSKHSLVDTCLPTQQSGTGFSYTIEHEAAHNLGLSHPHDGSYGVDKCTSGPNAGKWACYWRGLGWVYDISAAPTTYAMAYRPYEVEDQDNLQRGHVTEYLLTAQDALRQRLVDEVKAGNTSPSAGWLSDYNRMKQWRTQAGQLFRDGDYLHAEYAARNAAIAARGIPQTAANTSDPKLLDAGQVFYFNVHPQSDGVPRPNLRPTDITASQAERKQTVLTVAIANDGTADANGVVVDLFDGTTLIGRTAAVDVAAGASRSATLTWNTRAIRGNRQITANVDPDNTVIESNEADNSLTRTVTIRGERVENESFENSANGTAPDTWSSTGSTSYDTGGGHATDGVAAVSMSGGLLGGSWTTAPIAVTAGETLQLAASVAGAAPAVSVSLLSATGSLLSTVALPTTLTSGLLAASLTVPSGVSQLRLTFSAPGSLTAAQAVWLDDVWLW